jgi:aerobic carbon-monoxide dehydrogenase medium subunit
MYPAPFNYHRAHSVDEAVAMLSEIGEGARILAGGQSLLPILKLRFDEPTDLVDIGRIPGLDQVDDSGDEIAIGALITHRRIAASPLAAAIPAIGDCANGIADNQVRTRGTIGGSVSSGDPNCDWPALLHTLDARIVTQGPGGSRTLDINGFVEDLYQTILQPGEIVTAISLRRPAAESGGAYCGFKRCSPAYPTVSVGVQLTLQGGKVTAARVAAGSVGFVPARLGEVEAVLQGQAVDAACIERAAEAAAAAVNPLEDTRGAAAFKRRVTAAMTAKAIGIALRRANGETVNNKHEYY